MNRRQKFADELKWLQGTAAQNHRATVNRKESQKSVTIVLEKFSHKYHANDSYECTTKKPRIESQKSVAIVNHIVSDRHHGKVNPECARKRPRKESQKSVTIASETVSHKHHTNDCNEDTANRPRIELHISVMIRSEITSVINKWSYFPLNVRTLPYHQNNFCV
jgi:hypothetical protein